MLVKLVFLINAVLCLPLSDVEHNTLCTIGGRSYTGYRLLHDHEIGVGDMKLSMDRLKNKGVAIVQCVNGKVKFNYLLQGDDVFNKTIEIPTTHQKLRIARRNAYKDVSKLRYVPKTIVGTIFSVNTDGECVPETVLVADSWNRWHLNKTADGFSNMHVFTSLLRSPDVLESSFPRTDSWKKSVSCYE